MQFAKHNHSKTTQRTNLSSPSSKLASLSDRHSPLICGFSNRSAYSERDRHIMCAFHSGQKITNFCTNKQCLLPLCPKCIKIHCEQHQQLGVFGQFSTVEAVIEESRNKIESEFEYIEKANDRIDGLRQLYDSHIEREKKMLQDVRKNLHREFDIMMNDFQKQWLQYSSEINKTAFEQLNCFQQALTSYATGLEEKDRKMVNTFSRMEAVIEELSSQTEWTKVIETTQKVQRVKIKFINFELLSTEQFAVRQMIDKLLKWKQGDRPEEELVQSKQSLQQKGKGFQFLKRYVQTLQARKLGNGASNSIKKDYHLSTFSKDFNQEIMVPSSPLSFNQFKSPLNDFRF